MKRTTLSCPCGFKISQHDIDNGESFIQIDFVGECEVCAQNKGDYTKSPHWLKELTVKDEVKETKKEPKKRGW